MEGLPDIAPFRHRFRELETLVADPDFYSDGRRAATIGREHQQLRVLLENWDALERLIAEEAENRALAEDPSTDPELKEMAREELQNAGPRREKLHTEILRAMVPPDESDSRNTVMEVRAGTGGDEASLFAGDLYRMYSRYADARGWKVETLSASPSECGGFREVIFLVSGQDVYRDLRFESGVHRVQRVPVTEANGRIHTSTATVAVLPEAQEVDIDIRPDELEITVCRASGPGGQGVNTTDSAVQVLHKPTGLIVSCADERSQMRNKQKALMILRSRLLKQKQEEERARYDANRRSQIGSGERSERIRTYNFPQSRLTDHRIGLTLHSLPRILEGELLEVIHALQEADWEEKVAAIAGRPVAPRGHGQDAD